jgi:hypothetical protein
VKGTSLARFSVSAAALALAACDSFDDTTTGFEVTTSVVVDPVQFLGDLPCAPIAGAPRSYVATLVDLEDGSLVGPSPRLGCERGVAFEKVTAGHRYGATIEVYDVPAEDEGAPRWTLACADDGVGAAEVVSDRAVVVEGCDRLDGPGTATTAIVVDPVAALAPATCEADGGAIARVRIEMLDVLDGDARVDLACGEGPVTFRTPLTPNATTSFYVAGRGGDDLDEDPPAWGTICSAIVRDGLEMPATCNPATTKGSIATPVLDVLAEAGRSCDEGATDAQLAVDAVRLRALASEFATTTLGCGDDVVTAGLARGPIAYELEALEGGAVVASWRCDATVWPATTTAAACVAQP